MTKRAYRLFIEDILESINMIEEYICGLDQRGFSADRKTIDAVIRNIEIIGEAARNIPEAKVEILKMLDSLHDKQ